MKIKKNYLLLLAGIVWLAAGFNILRIGIISYKSYVTLINLDRIVRYEEEMQFILKFFDRKSFCIMAFMMTFGIGLRTSGLCPDIFIAVFYSGLGTALVLAGLAFTGNYITQAARNR